MAPRPTARLWHRPARDACLALCFGLMSGANALAQSPVAATYEGPTDRYPHGVLGDTIEHTTLTVTLDSGRTLRVTWDRPVVFEDTAPRLVDLNGDGRAEILTVEAHEDLGARIGLWHITGDTLSPLASTPWIGHRFRWLAPIGPGAADLDGDGQIELAYIDRPHLARTLRIWRLHFPEPGTVELTEIAAAPGLTNHRIGDPTIPGGLRDCGTGPEMITANANWTRVIATRLAPDDTLTQTDLGPWSPGALNAALSCPP